LIALQVLGIAAWVVFGLAGAWLLLTGRRLIYGLPREIKDGWPLRTFGLLYVLLAAFLIYQFSRGSFSPDGVVFTYAFFAVALGVYLYGRRKPRAADVSTPEA
jgi:hypothetical protein